MATSTLIQFLAAGEAGDTSHRRQVETYIAAGTIAAGEVVAFDRTQTGADRTLYVEKAGIVATGNGLAAGVALDGATAGEQVRVIVVNAAGTAAGQVEAALATDTIVFGVTVEAEAGGSVDLIVYKRF